MPSEFDALGLSFPITPEQRRAAINPEDTQKLMLLAMNAMAQNLALDADLTALAALATQPFGRSLLTAANAAAARDMLETGLAPSSSAAGTSREIWVAVRTDGLPGSGSILDPFDGSTSDKFDKLMREQAANFRDDSGKTRPLHIHLWPGTFLTKGEYHPTAFPVLPPVYPGIPVYPDVEDAIGWLMYDDWVLDGAGPGITEVKLDVWPVYEIGPWPFGHTVISGAPGNLGYGSHRAQVRNLTVNCNANALTTRPKGVKLNAVALYGNDCLEDNVAVKEAYGKTFTTQTGVSTAVGAPGIVTAPAHGLQTNDVVYFEKVLTAVSVANPAVVTSANHGRRTGETITLANVANVTPNINGGHTITVVDTNSFSLNGVNVTATGAVGATATWYSGTSYITRLSADTFSLQEPAFSDTSAAFTHAGSGLKITWGGGQGESFPLLIHYVSGPGIVGYPNAATDITGAAVRGCVVEDFATGSDYAIAITITPGATGSGSIINNVVRGTAGVNDINAFGVGGLGSRILNNRAENVGKMAHYDSARVSGLLIANNTCINSYYSGISLTPNFAGAVYDNIIISDNYFVNDTLTRGGWAINCDYTGVAGASFRNLIIRGNIFRHTGEFAIGAFATGVVVKGINGVVIEGNLVASTYDNVVTGNTNLIISNNYTELGTRPDDLENTFVPNLVVAGQPAVAKAGLVEVAAATPDVVGVATAFTTDFGLGDAIGIEGQIFSVLAIADDTHLTLSADHTGTNAPGIPFGQGNLFEVSNPFGDLQVFVDKDGVFNATVGLFSYVELKDLTGLQARALKMLTVQTDIRELGIGLPDTDVELRLGGNFTTNGSLIFGGTAPATAGATGVAGTLLWDADFIYVCVATNTWKRAAIATW